jgi:hypothetical protein
MDVVTWTGNGSSPRTISGLSFSPDLVWIKNRATSVYWNVLFDVIRGGGQLSSNQTDAELAAGSNVAGYVSAYTSSGFTLSAGSSNINTVNENGSGIVGWCWDAGSSTVTNTQGSITSSVRANATAGFSIVTYTGTGVLATVGHGLGIAPSFYIIKRRNSSSEWTCYHSALGATKYITLQSTAAAVTTANAWNNTAPTSSVFTINNVYGDLNANGGTYVAYCFAPVVGYSSFGSWQNNGSTDGTFVYTGMRPRFILLKNSDNAESWYIYDSSRHPYNVGPGDSVKLVPNSSVAEGTNGGFASTATIDLLSNGFKIRTTNPSTGEISFGTRTYIYAAFAESPFNYARAR